MRFERIVAVTFPRHQPKTPIEEAPIEEAPIEEAPIEEAPIEEAPTSTLTERDALRETH